MLVSIEVSLLLVLYEQWNFWDLRFDWKNLGRGCDTWMISNTWLLSAFYLNNMLFYFCLLKAMHIIDSLKNRGKYKEN